MSSQMDIDDKIVRNYEKTIILNIGGIKVNRKKMKNEKKEEIFINLLITMYNISTKHSHQL
jgi:hypothetical protein